jgi:1-deoxy-D-xylulose-5-phosphate reductoisomerase
MGKGRISVMSESEKEQLTPQDVLQRKTWVMGQKIGIDSATCINKAFEVIEAKWLFGLEPEQIQVVVHPEYLCHSLVEFVDGSIITELGVPDMKRYVAYAMFYPQRGVVQNIPDVALPGRTMSFESVDLDLFPGLRLGYTALSKGKRGAQTLYDTDEIAVQKFLKGEILFTHIVPMIEKEMRKL